MIKKLNDINIPANIFKPRPTSQFAPNQVVSGSGSNEAINLREVIQEGIDSGELTNIVGGVSNLALGTRTSTTNPITNSHGTGFTLLQVDSSNAGLMSAADKSKLDSTIAVTTVTVNTMRVTYIKLTGTPTFTFVKSAGVATMVVNSGTIKLLEVVDLLQPSETSGNSIRYDFVGTGTNKLDAYPTTTKYTINATTPSVASISDIGDQQDIDNTPPVFYGDFVLTGSGSMSARLNNISTNIYVKFTWTIK